MKRKQDGRKNRCGYGWKGLPLGTDPRQAWLALTGYVEREDLRLMRKRAQVRGDFRIRGYTAEGGVGDGGGGRKRNDGGGGESACPAHLKEAWCPA